jgi:tripeptide aminopeptidase
VSAIAIAALALADLQDRGWHGAIRKRGRYGTSNFGSIQGGEVTNVVTDNVVIGAEARSHDPSFRERIVSEIERSFRRAARAVTSDAGKHGTVQINGKSDYESFLLDAKEPCVQAAEVAVRSIGARPRHAVANGGLDANWMVARGIPTVSLGCGQLNAHTVTEALDIDGFQQACRIALRLAAD